MALTVTEIQQLYTAYLGRPADREGLDYWQAQGVSAAELRANLANDNQPEYVELYGDRTREELVTAIYQNMFGREPDEAGLEYWVNGEGAAVPASELQQLFIEAASTADRAAFNAQVALHEAEIEQPEPPRDTIDITFNTSTTGNPADIFGQFEVNADGELVQVARPESAAAFDQQQITAIGKAEWDAAGRPVTTSADYTFNMTNQLGSDKEYSGLFLSPLLTSESRSTNSQLFIELLDIRAAGTAEPLGNLPIDGIRFQVDGEAVVLRSDAIFEAKTYPQLLNAIREAIASNSDLAGFRAEIGSSFVATDGGQPIPGAVGSTIVLTDAQGREISGGSFTYSDQETGGFTLYGDLTTDAPETVRDLISTNLDLNNVGYGSQGGSINLAGESRSDKGIEQFNVQAQNGVWLTRLESETVTGTHALKEINLDGTGYFRVGVQDGQYVIGLPELLGRLEDAGLQDVQDFNGQNFEGDVRLNAYISDSVIARDLQATDTQDDPSLDDQTYTYQTADGDDQISLVVAEELLSRADAQVYINAGNGNNLVETVFVESDGELVNQQLNGNITIVTGSGADVVRTWGAGDVSISTGAGDDVVYADNSGLLTGDDATTWQFNSVNGAGDALSLVSNSDAPLSAGGNGVAQTFSANYLSVTVSFLGFESTVNVPFTGEQTTALQINQALKNAINNDAVLKHLLVAEDGNGNILNIESLIDGAYADQLDISFAARTDLTGDTTAIVTDLAAIEAIYGYEGVDGNDEVPFLNGEASQYESDNVINAGSGFDVIVLGTGEFSNDTVVFEGAFGTNTIVNFTDGVVLGGSSAGTPAVAEVFTATFAGTANDGDEITFNGTTIVLTDTDVSGTVELSEIVDQLAAAGFADWTVTDSDAAAGTIEFTANVAEDRTDVEVADFTGDVVPDAVDVDVQGEDAVVPEDANGGDILDFTSYLGEAESAFGAAIGANGAINVTTFNAVGFDADVTFAELSAANVAAEFAGQAQTGAGITNGVLLIENNDNAGEYKAFTLSSTDASDNFTVQLIGTIDFGATQDFDATNFA